MARDIGGGISSRHLFQAAVAFGAVLAAAAPAGAATTQTTFGVSANVQSVCAVAATALGFGSYNATSGSPNTASSTVTVTCTPSEDYAVALNAGTTSGGTVAARLLSDGASHTLAYNLYTANDYATKWGDGTLSTSTQSGTGDGTGQPYTVYGRIATGQYVTAGSYSDTVTVTVTY